MTKTQIRILRSIVEGPWETHPDRTWGRAARTINVLADLKLVRESVHVWVDDRGLERRCRRLEATDAGRAAARDSISRIVEALP